MKNNKNLLLLSFFLFFACTQPSEENNNKQNNAPTLEPISMEKEKTIEADTLVKEVVKPEAVPVFQIELFKQHADSLLKKLKGEQYRFEIETDTIDLQYKDRVSMKFHDGMFWHLRDKTMAGLVQHYIFAPETKKQFRIYLLEAHYENKSDLENKIAELGIAMQDSMTCPGCEYAWKIGLTPVQDYIIANEEKIYWLNLAYPYKRKEFLQFVSCLQSNLDSTYQGKILCYFGGACQNKKVP